MNEQDKRIAEFQSKIKALFEWDTKTRNEIDEQLKREGKYIEGLDTNQWAYRDTIKEFNRRFKEIIDKYRDLPPDTKLLP